MSNYRFMVFIWKACDVSQIFNEVLIYTGIALFASSPFLEYIELLNNQNSITQYDSNSYSPHWSLVEMSKTK